MSDTGLPGAARQISIQLTSDDLAHANMLHFLRNMRRPRTIMRLTASWLIGMTFIVLLISLIDWRLPKLGPFFTIYLLSILAGLFVLPFLYMLAFNGRVSRKRFARYRPLQVPRVADWSEIGLRARPRIGVE